MGSRHRPGQRLVIHRQRLDGIDLAFAPHQQKCQLSGLDQEVGHQRGHTNPAVNHRDRSAGSRHLDLLIFGL